MAADSPAPPVSSGPPPTVDAQDPLPESNWFWRRVFVFVFATASMVGLGAVLWIMWELGRSTLNLISLLGALRDAKALDNAVDVVGKAVDQLAYLGFWIIMLLFVIHILYLIAPSAEQATKMMATVSAWKGGVSTTSTARAVSAEGAVAEATKTATTGTLPTPVSPPPAKWSDYAG